LDTATPPSLSLGPLIFNGYSHTTKEESRLFKTPYYTAKLVLAREFERKEAFKAQPLNNLAKDPYNLI